MKSLSEKIGYALEHLVLIELERRGITVGRSERPTNESIKCDLSFTDGGRDFILFATHTRTQGMTNRKFYRSFEELSQRRIGNPSAICIDISLVKGASGVREQQDLIFDKAFDESFALLQKSEAASFVNAVRELPGKLSLEVTRANFNKFSRQIQKKIRKLVDQILSVQPNQKSLWHDFWRLEALVTRGDITFAPREGRSIKLGMKMLMFIDPELMPYAKVSCGSGVFQEIKAPTLEWLQHLGVISSHSPTLRGQRITFSEHATVAASFLQTLGIAAPQKWYSPYLTTLGAQRLYSDLTHPKLLLKRNELLNVTLQEASTEQMLHRALLQDYHSIEPRCDLIDMALRATDYTQNQISVDLIESHAYPLKLSDSIGFLIRKSEDLQAVVGDVDEYIGCVAKLIWRRCAGKFDAVSFSDFFESRVKTFYSNAYVCPELFILRGLLARFTEVSKSRMSVLPRICGLNSRFWMAVKPAAYLRSDNNKEVFVITISTPEERHHKHKEFSGKIRAIRHELQDGVLRSNNVTYLAIVDGFWTHDQLGMLAVAGWRVTDWDNLPSIVDAL